MVGTYLFPFRVRRWSLNEKIKWESGLASLSMHFQECHFGYCNLDFLNEIRSSLTFLIFREISCATKRWSLDFLQKIVEMWRELSERDADFDGETRNSHAFPIIQEWLRAPRGKAALGREKSTPVRSQSLPWNKRRPAGDSDECVCISSVWWSSGVSSKNA